jgi:TolA-binding protein
MESGDYTGAIAAYEESLPLLDSEAKARAFYWMGTSYEQLGDFQSAVIEYLKVPYLHPGEGLWVVTAQLKAAECYAQIDREDAAREIYEKVIRQYGADSNWGKLAKKGIESIDGTTRKSNAGGTKQ